MAKPLCAAEALLAAGDHLEQVAMALKECAGASTGMALVNLEPGARQLSSTLVRASRAMRQDAYHLPMSSDGGFSADGHPAASVGASPDGHPAAYRTNHPSRPPALDEVVVLDETDNMHLWESSRSLQDQGSQCEGSHRLKVVDGDNARAWDGSEEEVGHPNCRGRNRHMTKDSQRTVTTSAYLSETAVRAVKSMFDGTTSTRRRSTDAKDCRCMNRLEWFMDLNTTEFFFAVLITLNVVLMILEAQYDGARRGFEIGFYSHYGSPGYVRDTGGPTPAFFYYSECVFASAFTVELVLRLLVMRRAFFQDPWMYLDTTVVVTSDMALIGIHGLSGSSAIRAWRLMRLLRVLRLARKVQTFDSLYLMTTALTGSMSVVFWVCMLLLIIQTLCALLLTNIMHGFYLHENSSLTKSQTEEIFLYFGTYWRAMVSLFELMLANWPPICRTMMESLHEGWSVFVVLYKLTMGFGVVGVIMGVFTQETFKAAESDDQIMLRNKAKQTLVHRNKLRMLFTNMAGGIDSEITLNTFKAFLKDEDVKMWLKAMDYDTADASLLFYLIDKNDEGTLSVDELIEGLSSLQGTARNMDIKVLLRQSLLGRMQSQRSSREASSPVGEKASQGVSHSASDILRALETAPVSRDVVKDIKAVEL